MESKRVRRSARQGRCRRGRDLFHGEKTDSDSVLQKCRSDMTTDGSRPVKLDKVGHTHGMYNDDLKQEFSDVSLRKLWKQSKKSLFNWPILMHQKLVRCKRKTLG